MEERLVQIMMDAIERLDDKSGRSRVAVYNRVRKALIDHLDAIVPPISGRERMAQIRRVEQSIRRIEAGIRHEAVEEKKKKASAHAADLQRAEGARIASAGQRVGTVVTGLRPALTGTPTERARSPVPGTDHPVARSHVGRDKRLVNLERFRPSNSDRRQIRQGPHPITVFPLHPIAAKSIPDPSLRELVVDYATKISSRAALVNLLLRRHTQEAVVIDRLHFIWLVVEPMFQIGLIVLLYWVMQHTYVLDMPAIPFAVVGIGGWLMFRTVLRHVTTGAGREMGILNYPLITRFDIVLSRAIFYGLLYLMIVFLITWLVWYFGFGGGIAHLTLFLWFWFVLWIFAFGFGLACMTLIDVYPALRKLIPLLLRKLIYLSGVVIVTEQLPSEYRIFFLWNPICHALQLLRSAMFLEYQTEDGSAIYLYAWALGSLVFGLAAERANRKKVAQL